MPYKHARESFRRPTDQVRNLPVAHLNNTNLTLGSFRDVHRIETAAEAFGTIVDNGRHVACRRVRHAVDYEVTPFGVVQ